MRTHCLAADQRLRLRRSASREISLISAQICACSGEAQDKCRNPSLSRSLSLSLARSRPLSLSRSLSSSPPTCCTCDQEKHGGAVSVHAATKKITTSRQQGSAHGGILRVRLTSSPLLHCLAVTSSSRGVHEPAAAPLLQPKLARVPPRWIAYV